MKKVLIGFVCALCAIAISVNAQSAKKNRNLTDEQKAIQKEMIDKYDANKDGKLDKDERAKMSKEDKQKWQKAFGQRKGKDAKSEGTAKESKTTEKEAK
jgi:hypothetical protein